MPELNHVLAEILRNKFEAVVAEMRATLTSTAYSRTISEAGECCNVIFTETSAVVAIDNAVHLPSMGETALAVRDRFQYGLGATDVILTNDPYSGGTRVQDFTLIAPVSHREEIVAYLGVRGHIEDFGGDLRGNLNPKATEIWQEGARCTPLRLYREGRLLQDALNTVLLNSRSPESFRLDLEAMIAAVTIGRRRLEELIHTYEIETIVRAMQWSIDYSERRCASLIERWPDGEYAGEAALPHDCQGRTDLKVRVKLRVAGGALQVDFSEADAQSTSFVNATKAVTAGYALLPILVALGQEIPKNDGIARCVKVITRKGSLLDPEYPAPTGWSFDHLGCEIARAVVDALAKFAPKEIGTIVANRSLAFTLKRGVRHGDTLEQLEVFDYSRFAQGGGSGVWGSDGWGMPGISAMAPLPSVELYESRGQGQIASLELGTDSAGAGCWRGAFGTVAHIIPAQPSDGDLYLSVCVEDGAGTAAGHAGGAAGAISSVTLVRDREPSKVGRQLVDSKLPTGAHILLTTGGGPGWGSAFERDPGLVLQDVRNGLVSVEAARASYGLVIGRDGEIDADATRTARLSTSRS